MKYYCDTCNKEVETTIVEKNETYSVLGDNIEVDARVLTCNECGEELFCEELDSVNLTNAFNEYRKRHKLLLPEEIKMIREQYGLSQRSLAKLLGWGDKTIFRYENGSIQDKVHNSLLLFLRDPKNMQLYISENEIALNPGQTKRLIETVNQLLDKKTFHHEINPIDHYFVTEPSMENGFMKFDYDKFCAMVLFFAQKSKSLLKTKLMKLLNYSDMIFFKENGISISGVRYTHMQYGPVPENFDLLIGTMAADHIAHIEIVYENGYENHQVIADEAFPNNILSEKEVSVLERVYSKFADFGSKEISSYSHKEKGYISTNPGDIISYSYAKDIEGI